VNGSVFLNRKFLPDTRRTVGVFFALAVSSATLAMAPVVAWAEPAPAISADESKEYFDVWEYQVEGNSLLPTEDIERAVYGHLGEHKSIDDVTAAQQQLEALYHSRGYGTVLVDIPEQDVVGGVIRLKITEATVGKVTVTGSRYFSLGKIKAAVPSLGVGQAPHLPTVQKELAALGNVSRDRAITPVLKPGKTPGKLEVELKVKDELPIHGSIAVDDRFSADTTRTRISTNVSYDNLWQRGHSIGASYLFSPENPDEVEVLSGNYLWRFQNIDHLLSLYAVRSNSNIATVGTLGVLGNGTIAGLRYTVPLRALGTYFHSVTIGFDYKDFGESIGLQGNDTINTPISYSKFNAAYSGTLYGKESVSHYDLSLQFGVRGLGNNAKQFESKRFRAIPDFAYLHLSFDREQPLWKGVRIFGRLEGQAANSPLISNESYAAGGVANVRGYLESEKQGDDALSSTLELRYPELRPTNWDWLKQLEIFAYTDATGLRVRRALPGVQETSLLWSTGMGLRLTGFDSVNALLVWGYPLRSSERTKEGDERVHFSVGYDF